MARTAGMQQDSGSASMSDDGEPRQRRSGVAMVFKAATPTSPSGRRAPRARWSEEEAQRLAELVSGHSGTVPWGDIAKRLPGRTGKQCREKWKNDLAPDLRKDPWTDREEAILAKSHSQVGTQWRRIAKWLSGRSQNSIKNHWNALLRSLSSSSEPKRGPSLLSVYCEMILEQGSGAVLCTGSPQIYEQAKEHLSLLQDAAILESMASGNSQAWVASTSGSQSELDDLAGDGSDGEDEGGDELITMELQRQGSRQRRQERWQQQSEPRLTQQQQQSGGKEGPDMPEELQDHQQVASPATSAGDQEAARGQASQSPDVSDEFMRAEPARPGNEAPIASSSRMPSADGWQWRKYGTKLLKGKGHPSAYYKCSAYASCSCTAKKVVLLGPQGQVLEVTYKGEHSHSPPKGFMRASSKRPEASARWSGGAGDNARGSSSPPSSTQEGAETKGQTILDTSRPQAAAGAGTGASEGVKRRKLAPGSSVCDSDDEGHDGSGASVQVAEELGLSPEELQLVQHKWQQT